MTLRTWRFLAILLAALALTMESAHLLELPQKLHYDPAMYAAVNTTLYRYFAIVGGFYQVGSVLAATILALMVRRRRKTFRWTAVAAFCLLLAFCIWLAVVAPVNHLVDEIAHTEPDTIPEVWSQLRDRWEYGHVAGFFAQLTGLGLLLVSVLRETDVLA